MNQDFAQNKIINYSKFIIKFVTSLMSICLLFFAHSTLADSFVIDNIQIQGLQHLQESTVLSYLPVQVGESVDDQDTADILRVLYQTGFFDDVHLQRNGDTLVIIVTERPVIEEVQISGNKEIDSKKLRPVLAKLGISEGEIYDPAKLNAIKQGLLDQYRQLGYYSVQIDAQVINLPRNRVQIQINITEGAVAKVHAIKFVGNDAFSQKELRKQMSLKESGWFTWIGHKDRYARSLMDQDLHNLVFFYYNHGYLQFKVLSQQVIMSPDHKKVDIIIYVKEGPIYTVSNYQIVGVNDPAIPPLVTVKTGKAFSRQDVLDTRKKITAYYANHGRALARVNVIPQQNDTTHQVALTFQVLPGPIVYIRHINFAGNNFTNETVLRSSLLQLEGGPYSQSNIDESKRRLSNLPYLKNVNVYTRPIPNAPDQVDLDYHVTEVNAGKIMAQAGYSDTDGFLYGAGITEPNFLGSGKELGVNFQNSQYQKNYNINYVNPYYTTTGISRSVNLFYNIITPNSDTNRASYKVKKAGGTLMYGLPITRYDRINAGGGYAYIKLSDVDNTDTSPSIIDFLDDHPSPYNQFNGYVNWLHATLDRAIFPTHGYYQSLGLDLGVPVVSSSLSYYKLDFVSRYYYPLGYGFVLNPHGEVGYGEGYGNVSGEFPFYENFYAGGINSVPGYAPNSLGPLNPNNNEALGGNFIAIAGFNFIFPNFITERIRTSLALTAGNVFDTNKLASDQVNYEDISIDNLRTSVGLLVEFYSPFGPLQFDVAEALNRKAGDDAQLFDFALGTSF